jgi:hypothetical protein
MTSIIKVDQIQNAAGVGGLTIDSTGNLKFDETKAVVAELPNITFGTANTYQTLGSISIPTSGIWMVRTDLRLRTNASGFIRARLIDASSNEVTAGDSSSADTATRMLAELIGTPSSFNNIHVAASWILDMPTGLTYGSNITIQAYPTVSTSTNSIVNDSNGRPTLSAIKLNSTSTSGTTVTTIGGA